MFNDVEIEPILVLNPETKRYVNVAPLFYLINENYGGKFYEASKSIDNVIEMVACNKTAEMENNPSGFVNNMNTLFFFRNTINGIAEFKEERR